MDQYTEVEKALYLRFVWGRSRLPTRDSEFTKKHSIEVLKRTDPDASLPVSHTCFFSIELPIYMSLECLRDKLRYAFTHCTAIDTDGDAREVWSDHDDEDAN